MKIKILTHTQNPIDILYLAARQCYYNGTIIDFDINSIEEDQKIKLIKKLIKSGHTSVLEHVSFTFAINGISRACSHQLVRHRIGFSYSQQSQRYVEFDFSNMTNEQILENFVVPPKIKKENVENYLNFLRECALKYSNFIEDDIKPEDARYILPNASKTNIVVTANCRALMNFFSERCCNRAQWEIRDMANNMLKLCRDILPVVFDESGAKCEALGYCPEIKSCGRWPKQERCNTCGEQLTHAIVNGKSIYGCEFCGSIYE